MATGGSKPTLKQIAFLESRGITPPPTIIACVRLISYIIRGNGTFGDNQFSRVNIVKSFQDKWVGKKILGVGPSTKQGLRGTVGHLVARRQEDVFSRRRVDPDYKPAPFEAVVYWEDATTSRTTLSLLKLEEGITSVH